MSGRVEVRGGARVRERRGERVRPVRLGFLGVGWIGRNRLEAVVENGGAEIAAVVDTAPDAVAHARAIAPDAEPVESLDDLLALGVDGVVIATPSAQHAEEAVRALEGGAAVFCQKPLGRTEGEVAWVVEAARRANRLLGVDLSYRHTSGVRAIRELVRSGELGEIYAVDLVFHNAYGPDKSWFYDPRLSGGGCMIDLGIHLIDLALWVVPEARVVDVQSRLYSGGRALEAGEEGVVEDYGVAQLELAGGAVVRVAASWRLPAGCDALIEASFYGTEGGASFRNVAGSFYDFVAEQFRGTHRQLLAGPPDAWGGRGVVGWVERVAAGERYDPGVAEMIEVARTLDLVYSR